jgi:TonB family protein
VTRPLPLTCALVATLFLSSAVIGSFAQTAKPKTEQEGVVLVNLSPPLYPRLARQAHIKGDVELVLHVRQDGSVESAAVVSGHPLLKEAALDSARKSQFECRNCTQGVNLQHFVYTFEFGPTVYCSPPDASYPRVVHSATHVTVIDQPIGTCDPAAERVRSAKCLYLWRCGEREIPIKSR